MPRKSNTPARWERPLDLEFLENSRRVKGKRVFAVIAFGDTVKFKRWTNHPFASVEKHTKFMVDLYDEFIRFRNGSGYFVKILGDGLMAVSELPSGNQRKKVVENMLVHSQRLVASVNRLIKGQAYPRPTGFRMRVVAGDVLKLIATHSTDERKQQIDYAAYPVSLAHSLLQIEKDVPCICHESVREIINGRGSANIGIRFERIKAPNFHPEGIDPDDLKALWAFQAVAQ